MHLQLLNHAMIKIRIDFFNARSSVEKINTKESRFPTTTRFHAEIHTYLITCRYLKPISCAGRKIMLYTVLF